MVFRDSVYVVLLLNLQKNLNPSSILLSSRGRSYASLCSNSAGDVLKVAVYILILSLCMLLLSFF